MKTIYLQDSDIISDAHHSSLIMQTALEYPESVSEFDMTGFQPEDRTYTGYANV